MCLACVCSHRQPKFNSRTPRFLRTHHACYTDNLPVSDPTYLFDRPEFKTTGAMMFADFWQTDPRNPIYKVRGVMRCRLGFRGRG